MANVYLIHRYRGRMANNLLCCASALAWCIDRGHNLYYPSFWRYADLFPRFAGQRLISPTNPDPCDWPRERRQAWQRRRVAILRAGCKLGILRRVVKGPGPSRHFTLSPACDPVEDYRKPVSCYLTAWRFNNPEGLAKHHTTIAAAFRAQHEVELDADAFASAMGGDAGDAVRVGVHVRYGDYRAFMGGRYFYPIERYRAEMRAVADLLAPRPVRFAIFSDEPRTAAEFQGFEVVISQGSAIQDLARMRRMAAVIGPPTTYNAFATYLGHGVAYHFGNLASDVGDGWVYEGLNVATTIDSLRPALAQVVVRLDYRPSPPAAAVP